MIFTVFVFVFLAFLNRSACGCHILSFLLSFQRDDELCPLINVYIKLTHSFPMHPHAPGNSTPLKFHCAL